jgi:NADPH-dependent ferric siderophore reductase
VEHQPTARVGMDMAQIDLSEMRKTWRRIFTKQAIVHCVDKIADRFYLITLQSSSFKGRSWTAGQKVQIAMGSGFATRTYTPIDWNPSTGVTRILGYAHGNGPGNDWLRNMRPGDQCDVLGPNASLDLERVSGPIVIVGDETSIGLAYALQQEHIEVQTLLEVGAVENAQAIAKALQLRDVRFFLKSKEGAHLPDIARELTTLADDGATFVLTGNAESIQQLRQGLKSLNVPSTRQFTKAYWAPRKTGLD